MRRVDEQLLEAAGSGDVNALQKSLDEGGNVHVTNDKEWTPLHIAAKQSSGECCQLLLHAKADIEARTKNDATPLHFAARQSSVECCQLLLHAKADIEARDKNEITPLHFAANQSSVECCQLLLHAKADIEARDKNEWTPLHIAAIQSSVECCQLLLHAKADIEARDKGEITPLHFAAIQSSVECCQVLLHAKADIEARTKNQWTPMHFACLMYDDTSSSSSFNTIIQLIQWNAAISAQDKDNKTPLDCLSKFKRKNVEQEYEKIMVPRKLLLQGKRPLDVVKLFICGDPAAGKSTLKQTLTKKLSLPSFIREVFGRSKEKEKDRDPNYHRTAGIDVSRQSVPGVGKFIVWDCAGQQEYSITHGMLLGTTTHSIFLVLYDLASPESRKASIRYWLPFIRATNGKQDDRPQVILIGTHLDVIRDQEQGNKFGHKLLEEAQELFESSLDIDSALILVDSRNGDSDGMKLLKTVLKKRAAEMIKTKQVPLLCDKLLPVIESLLKANVPVINWNEYQQRVRAKFEGIDEDTLRAVTSYFHLLGEIYWAKFNDDDKEDQLILDTQWFTHEIIGKAFAGEEFQSQFPTLPNQQCYTLEELLKFFPKLMNAPRQLLSLLDHMDIVHETSDGKFLIPGKLPISGPEINWDHHQANELRGRRIACSEDIEIFSPNVFPSVQKLVLDEYSRYKISRSAVSYICGKIEVFVTLAKHKDIIDTVVSYPSDEKREAHSQLAYIFDLILSQLLEKSSGTNLQHGYISQVALQQKKDIAGLLSFSKEELLKAEDERGFIVKDGTYAREEDISKILFQGYDTMFLKELGSRCHYKWLPVKAAGRCFDRLDTKNDLGEDYTAVGKALGFQQYQVTRLAEESRGKGESPTKKIIKEWCSDKKHKMTIGVLQQLLTRLSLVENADALLAIDEVVEEYAPQNADALLAIDEVVEEYAPHTHVIRRSFQIQKKETQEHTDNLSCVSSHDVDSTSDFGVTDKLVRWRQVIKRIWEQIKRDLVPARMTSSLNYLPDTECSILEDHNNDSARTRLENAERLLQYLLHWQDERWPEDFQQGLRETGQEPLANALQVEYEQVLKEEQDRKEKFSQSRLRQRAFIKFKPEQEKGATATAAAAAAATGTD